MKRELWQALWQVLEDAYNEVRECKGTIGPVNLALDSILDHLDAAQCVCERNGATVPVEE